MRHAELLAPLHVSHEAWQVEHVPRVPTSSTKPPVDGHSVTQAPAERKGVLALVQLKQLVLDGPSHVPQDGSHGSQTPLLLAYLPAAVHEATHEPGAL